jgi:hypothetical protein
MKRALLLLIAILFSAPAWAQVPAFVQSNYFAPSLPQTSVTVPFSAAQQASDLNAVVVRWFDPLITVLSVTDTKGNVYTLVGGAGSQPNVGSQTIYYAKNIAAAAPNTNGVTIVFSGPANHPDIAIVEYSGVDTVAPLDAITSTVAGNGPTSSATLTTTTPNDLIFAANKVQTTTLGPGAGCSNRIISVPNGDISEDCSAVAPATYTIDAKLSGTSGWIMQAVAFKPRGGRTTVEHISIGPVSQSIDPNLFGGVTGCLAGDNGCVSDFEISDEAGNTIRLPIGTHTVTINYVTHATVPTPQTQTQKAGTVTFTVTSK